MKCPHCSIHFHDNWDRQYFDRGNAPLKTDFDGTTAYWMYRSAFCPGCREWTIQMALARDQKPLRDWRRIYRIDENRGPLPAEGPREFAQDYNGAWYVLLPRRSLLS